MLLFETKIKFFQYFLSSLGCFCVVPIYYQCFYANENNDLGLFFIGTVCIILGIIQFSFTLKSFQIYTDSIVVTRPMFIFKQKRKFAKNEIEKIIFRQSKSRIGGGNYLIVCGRNLEESFMLIYSSKTLKEFIAKLKEVEIITEVKFKIE